MYSRPENLKSIGIPTPKFEGVLGLTRLTIKIFFDNFVFMVAITLIPFWPIEIGKYFFVPEAIKFPLASWRYDCLVDDVFSPLVIAMVVFGISNWLKFKRPPSVSKTFRFGLSQWAGVWVKYFQASWLILFGFLMLVVPGILMSISCVLLGPVVCFEGLWKKSPLQRSRELSIGFRRLIFNSTLIIFLLNGLFVFFVSELTMIAIRRQLGTQSILILVRVIEDYIFFIVTPLPYILSLLIYLKARNKRLKTGKELWFLKWAP